MIDNAIALKRAELTSLGVELTDMTDTNPTRHGLFDPEIMEILARHLDRAGRYEPHPAGPWPARAALAERYGGSPEDYWLCASTSEAYSWVFTLLRGPKARVAIPCPGYPLVEPLATYHGFETAPYHSLYAHPSGWELDHDSLQGAVEGAKALVVINPNNPTGAYADPSLVDIAASRGLALIADEVFHPFALADTAAPRLLGGDASVVYGFDGLSKLLAAPQVKLAWIRLSGPRSATKDVRKDLDQIADTYLSVGTPVALALPDLLGLADQSVHRVVNRVKTNLETAQTLFNNLRVRTVHGGWMVLVDVPQITDADRLCIALMERAGLYVHPGYFYDLDSSTLALSLLPTPEVFTESCTRLVAALSVLATES